MNGAGAEPLGQRAVGGDDRLERVAVEAEPIHLVDRDGDLADAEQVGERGVAAGLRQQLAVLHPGGVDQDHGRVGGGRPGDHVARVLLVARRVGDDELALRGREVAVGDVDRDALLALGLEAVGEERQVDRRRRRRRRSHRAALGGAGQRGELVLEDAAAVVEQAADQRALAVVDAAGGDEAQDAVVLEVRRSGSRARCVHQKYPSRLRRSIEASEVWSSMRVAPRSVISAPAVSTMICSSGRARRLPPGRCR